MFYGAEIGSFGNIFLENLTMQRFTETVNQNPVIRGLYSIPFEIILSELSKDSDINEMIKLVNNPYWMIKNLYPKYSKRLEEVINNLQ
jgi:hypothetical protein